MERPTNLGYYLLRAFTWFVQLFPLRVLYVVSDVIYLLIYYVFRYRKKVVLTNLRNSFPEKSEKEIKTISRKFYQNFCDTFIETLYFDRIKESELKKRITIINQDFAEKFMRDGRQLVIMMGHYNNWEWLCGWPLFASSDNDHKLNVIYKKLRNKSFDFYYYQLRSRFGSVPLERADTYRKLLEDDKNGKIFASAFLMDQTPRIHEIQYWTTFLNQDTPILTGTEKVAKKLNAVVIFLHIKKVKRGYNQVEFVLITENARETAPFEITEKGTRVLEGIIKDRPELWLWSHKRWKHKREK